MQIPQEIADKVKEYEQYKRKTAQLKEELQQWFNRTAGEIEMYGNVYKRQFYDFGLCNTQYCKLIYDGYATTVQESYGVCDIADIYVAVKYNEKITRR